jgi:DNA-directed RNA polymerase specialized sigma24 family protein
MVTALRAGDQLAIGQIYDTYGARLYAYCYDLLADHELAADALRDAFIVGNNRVRELANPDELGAWLYALTRNEALRLGVSDDIPADAAQSTRGDKFARAALDVYAMLPPETREILDLAFRHRMVDGDLALVLDVAEEQVSNIVQDAQDHLENGLTAVLANRVGDPRCAEIAELGKRFDRLDGKGVDPWLESVERHVERDKACAEHIANRRPLRLFEELPHAFVPPGVRARVLDTLRDPAGAAFCQRIATRAGSFDESGFPTGGRSGGTGARKLLPLIGAAGLVVAMAAGAWAIMGKDPAKTATPPVTTSSPGGATPPGTSSTPAPPVGSTGTPAPADSQSATTDAGASTSSSTSAPGGHTSSKPATSHTSTKPVTHTSSKPSSSASSSSSPPPSSPSDTGTPVPLPTGSTG